MVPELAYSVDREYLREAKGLVKRNLPSVFRVKELHTENYGTVMMTGRRAGHLCRLRVCGGQDPRCIIEALNLGVWTAVLEGRKRVELCSEHNYFLRETLGLREWRYEGSLQYHSEGLRTLYYSSYSPPAQGLPSLSEDLAATLVETSSGRRHLERNLEAYRGDNSWPGEGDLGQMLEDLYQEALDHPKVEVRYYPDWSGGPIAEVGGDQ